jgi:hypothetical protein
MRTIVISGSASLTERMRYWNNYFQSKGYIVLAYPKPIDPDKFTTQYPNIHKDFYDFLSKTNIHFVANETKNGIEGYIGPGVFAEISLRIGLNLTTKNKARVILLTIPSPKSFFYNDIKLWESLGWLEVYKKRNELI